MLHTTAESLHEVSPLINASADLAITADARIDNREVLISLLDFKHESPADIADNELILAAYEKWGENCPVYLLGDFAFVVWDRRRRILFCSRDHFGVKPLYYYYLPGHFFAFASEIKGLLCSHEVPRRLNEVQVADYLSGLFEDKANTFYENILRLPPAHSLTVGADRCLIRRHWELDPSAELRLASDEEYAASFQEKFTDAIRCRLRSAFPIGSHLSGGLDSSSVTCVARNLLREAGGSELHTFSNIFDDVAECDERPYINTVLDQGGYVPHYIHADRSSPLVDLERVFWHQDEPSIGPNHFLPWGLNQSARQAGVRILLDGFDGDTTVSHGVARFTELARAGEWKIFAQEASAVAHHFKVSPYDILQAYGLANIEELAKKQRWISFATAIQQINRNFHASRRKIIWHHGVRPLLPQSRLNSKKGSRSVIDPIVNPDFGRLVGLRERIELRNEVTSKPPRTNREDQWRKLTSGLFATVLELSDRSAAAFLLEARHPFMDKRLIEFCLALPVEQKLHQGWGRIVMRRAMSGILPAEICWRGGKADMTPNFLHGLLILDRAALEEGVLKHPQAIEKYINIDHLTELYQRLISSKKVRIADAITVCKAVTFGYWLRSAGFC
jgi:asparagine synthase (glutamine-hydrolysing)